MLSLCFPLVFIRLQCYCLLFVWFLIATGACRAHRAARDCGTWEGKGQLRWQSALRAASEQIVAAFGSVACARCVVEGASCRARVHFSARARRSSRVSRATPIPSTVSYSTVKRHGREPGTHTRTHKGDQGPTHTGTTTVQYCRERVSSIPVPVPRHCQKRTSTLVASLLPLLVLLRSVPLLAQRSERERTGRRSPVIEPIP